MVTVVIHQHGLATTGLELAILLEAATHPLELGKRQDDGLVADPVFGCDRDGGSGVERVVHPRQIEGHLQLTGTGATHPEAAAIAGLHEVQHLHVGISGQTIGDGRTADLRQQATDHGIIHAHHGQSVERQVVQEVDEGGLQLGEVTAIGVHVIRFDVGHYGYHGLQMQEGGIALIRFGDQVTAAAQACIGAGAVEQTADDEGGIPVGLGIDARHQTGGGGLAMGAGDGDTVTEAHQLGQHLGAAHHRDAQLTGGQQLGVVLLDGGRHHHHARLVHMLGAVAHEDVGTERGQSFGHRIARQIGAGDLIPLVGKHLGDPAHTGATDADKVNAAHAAHFGDHGTQFCQFNLGHSSLFKSAVSGLRSAASINTGTRLHGLACAILLNMLSHSARWRAACTHRPPARRHR
ncbi:hypothetical protein D3C79_645780 [compost metagenome]